MRSARSAGAARSRAVDPRHRRLACALLAAAAIHGEEVEFLASLYSFGVLLTFTLAQAAVLWLRLREPDLPRPFRAGNVSVRGAAPGRAARGHPAHGALWIAAIRTHDAARIGGPPGSRWGRSSTSPSGKRAGRGCWSTSRPRCRTWSRPRGRYNRILVPVKLGLIGEEVLATALKLAEEHGCTIHALHVVRVPLEKALDAQMLEEEERAGESLTEATPQAGAHGVAIKGTGARPRDRRGDRRHGEGDRADLVVMGSAPRWRRQSRFFSPTVDHVLRKAPCEVMVVAYPQGVLEDDLSAIVGVR